jgi:hypothetical protein
MVFKRTKTNAAHRAREWRAWIDQHRAGLAAIGLPPEVYLDESRWNDFLENGHLHWHESSGFEFGDLSPAQLAALKRFLDQQYGATERRPPLLEWLRVRCDEA